MCCLWVFYMIIALTMASANVKIYLYLNSYLLLMLIVNIIDIIKYHFDEAFMTVCLVYLMSTMGLPIPLRRCIYTHSVQECFNDNGLGHVCSVNLNFNCLLRSARSMRMPFIPIKKSRSIQHIIKSTHSSCFVPFYGFGYRAILPYPLWLLYGH